MCKKITGIAVVCILAISLSACGGNNNGTATTPAATETPITTVTPEVPDVTQTPGTTDISGGNQEESENAARDLYEKSISGVELPQLADMPEDMFLDSYGIDQGILKSYTIQMPLMNVQATEVGVFQVKDKADIDAVKEGIEKRVAALEETWKTYLPEQYELVQQYKLETKDDYILFVIAEDSNSIVLNFMNALK